MSLDCIYLKNFRNIKESVIDFNAPEIFFIGTNGQGKTNLLESIYYLCYGSSFRTRDDNTLCHNHCGSMYLSAKFKNGDDDENKIEIRYRKKKEILLNNKHISDRKEIIRNFPCIIFSHDDINFVNGTPEKKRLFIDQTLSLYNPYYIDNLRKYKKILKIRNHILKEKKHDLLKVYNEQFVDLGLELQKKRKEVIALFNPVFSQFFNEISGISDKLEIVYDSTWASGNKKTILEYLNSKLNNEMLLGSSLSGPHRDRIIFSIDNMDFTSVGSTGQLRLISLLLRILQASFYSKTTGKKPILLLDDVLLELDSEKRKMVLERLPEYEQAFFTFLPNEHYLNYHKGETLVYHVEEGSLRKNG